MPLILLHGIAQETRTAESLLKLWSDSLAIGIDLGGLSLRLDDIHIAAPYYGRLLARLSQNDVAPPAQASPNVDDQLRSGSKAAPIAASIEGEIIAEISRRTGRRIKPADEDDLKRGLGNVLLGALGSVLPNAAQAKVVDQVIKQVEAYLAVPATRAEIQAKVQAALSEADVARTDHDSRLVVVGHSLGSVVALEAIWEWTGTPIDLLVTIGSPLSIGGVHSRLPKSPPRWPLPLRRWVNVADRDDVVALYGAIDRSNLFESAAKADPAARADVFNILDVRNHMSNHHGIAGYLDDPVVARVICDGIAMT